LLFEVTELFDMQTRPELVMLQKTMVVVEGVSRTLNPKFNMWKAAEPVVGDWIRDNLGPKRIAVDVKAGAIAAFKLAEQLPDLSCPHRAFRQRGRRHGRKRPALRRGHIRGHRQGRSPPHPLGPHCLVGDRCGENAGRDLYVDLRASIWIVT
jgi:predicted unusual protein kinase regulating ubiquinone biosynthesis (AarF/ABC1/UbiB family)